MGAGDDRASRPRIADAARTRGRAVLCAAMPLPTILAALAPVLALIALTPDPIAFHIGPIPVAWYGICYAVGLAVAYIVITREARRRGLNARLVDNGIIIVAAAALVGGRLYHVIDQWDLLQGRPAQDHPAARTRGSASTAGSSPARSPPGTSPAAGTSRSGSGPT